MQFFSEEYLLEIAHIIGGETVQSFSVNGGGAIVNTKGSPDIKKR